MIMESGSNNLKHENVNTAVDRINDKNKSNIINKENKEMINGEKILLTSESKLKRKRRSDNQIIVENNFTLDKEHFIDNLNLTSPPQTSNSRKIFFNGFRSINDFIRNLTAKFKNGNIKELNNKNNGSPSLSLVHVIEEGFLNSPIVKDMEQQSICFNLEKVLKEESIDTSKTIEKTESIEKQLDLSMETPYLGFEKRVSITGSEEYELNENEKKPLILRYSYNNSLIKSVKFKIKRSLTKSTNIRILTDKRDIQNRDTILSSESNYANSLLESDFKPKNLDFTKELAPESNPEQTINNEEMEESIQHSELNQSLINFDGENFIFKRRKSNKQTLLIVTFGFLSFAFIIIFMNFKLNVGKNFEVINKSTHIECLMILILYFILHKYIRLNHQDKILICVEQIKKYLYEDKMNKISMKYLIDTLPEAFNTSNSEFQKSGILEELLTKLRNEDIIEIKDTEDNIFLTFGN